MRMPHRAIAVVVATAWHPPALGQQALVPLKRAGVSTSTQAVTPVRQVPKMERLPIEDLMQARYAGIA